MRHIYDQIKKNIPINLATMFTNIVHIFLLTSFAKIKNKNEKFYQKKNISQTAFSAFFI